MEVNTKLATRYRSLLRSISKELTKDDLKYIRRALDIAIKHSENKKTFLEDDYIAYPFAIARILAKELGLGQVSITSALLYHFYKDGDITIDELKKGFAKKHCVIVEGLEKISSFDSRNNLLQADNFRKLILTISSDLRVILIKLAERLYIMRHLHRFSPRQQESIATEVAFVYAPLAHRLGLYAMKTELEDLSLKFRDPDVYLSIEENLKNTTARRNKFIRKFIEPLKDELDMMGFECEIKGRTKSIHSIWNKMKKQQCEFEDIYDIFAIRIILKNTIRDEKSDCWAVYSLVANLYQPNPTRMRDWISIPKSNGYESLHTTVLVPGGKWVEVQIRTQRMDELAEKGLAAHWKYKGGEADQHLEKWLSRVRDVIENTTDDSLGIADEFNLALYEDEVFVFTPKGELKKYPKGATVLDFAFDIHSNVGGTCTGARINGKNVPIRHVLKSGDEVEVITSKNQKPKEDWLDVVITTRAKTKIKQLLRLDKYKDADVGREMLIRRLKNWKLEFSDDVVKILLKHFKLHQAVDLYYGIATDHFDMAIIKELLVEKPSVIEPSDNAKPIEFEKDDFKKLEQHDNYLIIDEQLSNVDFKFAKCCNPIMGDDIFGFVTVTEGIKIHRNSCPNAQQLIERYPYRVVKAKWTDDGAKNQYETIIKLTGYDQQGLVNNISNIISKDLNVNMRSVSFNSHDGLFDGKINVMVRNKDHLVTVMNKIARVKGVTHVERYDNFE